MKTSKPYWKKSNPEWEDDCFKETKTSVDIKIPQIKKTSKEKMQLEAFINKFDGVFQVEREYKFHPVRKWRFDWAVGHQEVSGTFNAGLLVAIEYDGGVFTGGGHVRGVIFSANAEKLNEAALMGWTVLRFTAPMVRAGMHESQINRALGVAK